ncbi:MAG: putative sulfate/molybdate transporter [Myxococcaceae bacterium]|nr:putative sulfate/molybdate transporter [Myxococcaceae bacterium]
MSATPRLRFDRHELAGAFGDIGTDLPLLIALVATRGLDAASVFIVFGALQIATGLAYGMPMPVQPLKAMAAIMLAQKLSAGTLAGGGLVIGVTMLVLATTGLLDWLARVVPKEVVRGIQLGLGLSLATLGLKDYVVSDGARGMALALIATLLLIALRGGRRRVPAPLLVMGLGLVYALVFHVDVSQLGAAVGFRLPSVVVPTQSELLDGALLLALPQLPLSLGNSVIATSRATEDLFPERPVTVRRIGLTYGLMNVIAPWFGGVPTCHGCGGLVGFHAFGARTGGAAVIYGSLYLVLGLFFAPGLATVVKIFPMPVLGVVLLFEALALMLFIRDVASEPKQLYVVLAVAAAVVGLKYGYVVGLLGGTALALALRRGLVTPPGPA